MSGKVKMRCAQCGKRFTATGNKQTLCQDCAARQRQAKASSKLVQPATKAASTPVPAPRISGPAASLLTPGGTIPKTDVPRETGPAGASARKAEHSTTRETHQHEKPLVGQSEHPAVPAPGLQRPALSRQPQAPARKEAHKEPRPAPPRFELTPELRERIEARYLELANPVEFDGIRTRIAQELQVPKGAVKRVIAELRTRMQLPSWWELQGYRGDDKTLEQIRAAYLPLLPVPPVGVHKRIAAELHCDATQVYQAIRRIRAEMRLPQYNAPELHSESAAAPSGSVQPLADARVTD